MNEVNITDNRNLYKFKIKYVYINDGIKIYALHYNHIYIHMYNINIYSFIYFKYLCTDNQNFQCHCIQWYSAASVCIYHLINKHISPFRTAVLVLFWKYLTISQSLAFSFEKSFLSFAFKHAYAQLVLMHWFSIKAL